MATIVIPNFLTPKSVVGLNTYTYTANAAAMHVVKMDVKTLPPSGCVLTIQQNGSTMATISAPPLHASTPQSSVKLSTTLNCASGDVISMIISSSSAIDQGLNSVKTLLNVHIGSSN